MIPTLLRISWTNLRRDTVALGVTFVLPVIFFSIFAVIFGGMGGGGGGGIGTMKIVVVDEDGTDVSRRFIEALDDQGALEVYDAPAATEDDPRPTPYDRESGRKAVRGGQFPIAVIIPKGFGAGFGDFGGDADPIDLIHDPSNPLARHAVSGLIQASAMMAAPDILMERGLEALETFGGALTPEQRKAVDEILPVLRGDASLEDLAAEGADTDESDEDSPAADTPAVTDEEPLFTGLVAVNAVSAREEDTDDAEATRGNSIISYYAAGIGVMFLLFSMAGAAGSLLEEEATGTLDRVLTSSVGMGTLLAGHWLFFTIVGALQLTIMFLWGTLVFGLDLFTANHLAGFVVMTAVTASAAAAFGLLLATICRSRAQLSGISTVVILTMSALGGSMVPKFVMPAFMETTSLFTFNGWALDGYLKVFWYDDPAADVLSSLASLLPQLAVLATLAVVFMLIARGLARRWETT